MSKQTRDFYHIQDQLNLAWQYSVIGRRTAAPEIKALTDQINNLMGTLQPLTSEMARFIELTSQKASLLEKALEDKLEPPLERTSEGRVEEGRVEVSLSSSGMGFFSQTFVEEDSQIGIALKLDTVGADIDISATVLESRLSADSENPGYWVRVRFDRNQEYQVDQLLAHVTQRQIERLQKKSQNQTDGMKNNVSA